MNTQGPDTVRVSRAVVGQRVARLPFPVGDGGASPTPRLHFTPATADEVNWLLTTEHYLGPISGAWFAFAGWHNDELVACQAYRWPTARMLPADGSWLELSRWCLTDECGKNAGSRMMRWVANWLRRHAPTVSMLVSYSDPTKGHTGALYRASGWRQSLTHIGRRYHQDGIGYPSGNGSWDRLAVASPKDRWLYSLAAQIIGDVAG